MEGQQGIEHNNGPTTLLIHSSIKDFVKFKLTENGWFTTNEDNAEVTKGITSLLLALYLQTDHKEVFDVLFSDSEEQTDFARGMSTRFLSLDPALNDPSLRLLVSSIFSFFQDFLWRQRLPPQWRMGLNDNSSITPGPQDDEPIAPPRPPPEGILARFFEFPGEIRNIIYRETLIASEGTLVRSFTPPPLLCASRRLRDEALPLFYKHNHFEITVRRTLQDDRFAAGRKLPGLDMRVWRRFLDMWNIFNWSGTDGLQYVQRVTVIYQLSVVNGYPFRTDAAYDVRLGFRFSSAPPEADTAGSPSDDQA